MKSSAIQDGVDILEGLHAHTKSEGHLQAGITRFTFFQCHFVLVVHSYENLGQGDVFLSVEIKDEVRVGEN